MAFGFHPGVFKASLLTGFGFAWLETHENRNSHGVLIARYGDGAIGWSHSIVVTVGIDTEKIESR